MANGRTQEITGKVTQGQRVSAEDAKWLWQNATDLQLQDLATAVKRRFHPDLDQATYLKMAIVNYTNICVAKCDYCSFFRLPHQEGTYLLNKEQVFEKIDQLLEFGGNLVAFNGGFHPKLRIHDYAELFSAVHKRYPDLTFYEMTVAEFIFACRVSKVSLREGAEILKKAGTQWVTGGGAEIMADSFRMRHSPGKFKVEEYYQGQQAILDSGLGSTATMVIGFDETIEERFTHLERLREFQSSQSENPLASFLCWTYKPWNNEFGGKEIETKEYLRWMAICRIYLDNFENIRTSVLTKNKDALLGLLHGANDFDLPTEDEVTQKAGAEISHEFEEVLEAAKDIGITPKLREPFANKTAIAFSTTENQSLSVAPQESQKPDEARC